MRAVVLEVPDRWLREREAAGLDRWDEMWEGVLHMTPPPGGPHQLFGTGLARVLGEISEAQGLLFSHETGLFRTSENYRVPDLVLYRVADASVRGVEGRAELVIEIRSPHDESYEKLPFYAACSVPEVLIVDPGTKTFDLFRLTGDAYELVMTPAGAPVVLTSLPLSLATIDTPDGPGLHVTWAEGERTI